jgi:hypothetical protein
MEEKGKKNENVLNYERDWQRIKDQMIFLETDEEREALLKQFILQNTRL